MKTKYTVIMQDGGSTEYTVDLPDEPGLKDLKPLILPHLDGDDLEHVRVFVGDAVHGKYVSMFVGDISALDGHKKNDKATEIYWNNWMTHLPPAEMDKRIATMPFIYGNAVLFDRNVWF